VTEERVPAWGLRVIAEEQLRMAASGAVSLFRSPLSALAALQHHDVGFLRKKEF
jgi:hypothetical protein